MVFRLASEFPELIRTSLLLRSIAKRPLQKVVSNVKVNTYKRLSSSILQKGHSSDQSGPVERSQQYDLRLRLELHFLKCLKR